jgi:hypothetical protein
MDIDQVRLTRVHRWTLIKHLGIYLLLGCLSKSLLLPGGMGRESLPPLSIKPRVDGWPRHLFLLPRL